MMVRRGGAPNTVLIHATGWVKVPVQFLALAVVAKAENNQNCLNSPGVLVRLDHLSSMIVNAGTASRERLTLLPHAVLFSVTHFRWISVDLG